ncbi:MAG TPA: ABC transporter permease, partial [Roseiflexaceae bacterium]|nr:ABC transporter permease [Roseiflexaceae bacterium]
GGAARRWLAPLALTAALALVWEGAKLLLAIPDQKLPHLSAVAGQFFVRTQGGNGPLWASLALENALVTFGEALAGFVLGALLGCLLATLFAGSRLLERSLLPLVVGSQMVPILALAPMVVVGLGRLDAPDWLAKAVVAAYLTFFPVTIGMLRGLRSVPPDALALMRSYAASPTQIFLKLRLPAALPHLFTALKIASTASVIGAIVAELPAGSKYGVGVMLLNAAQYYNSRPPALFASVAVAGAVGLCFYALVLGAERLLMPAGLRAEN